MPVTERPNSFGIDGPIMTGQWVNPQTGDKFTVRDSFFQDGQYVVQTMDGRMLGYNQLQQYVKMETLQQSQRSSSLPPEVEALIGGSGPASNSQDILPEDMAMIAGSPVSKNSGVIDGSSVSVGLAGISSVTESDNPVKQPPVHLSNSPQDFDLELIRRILNNKINIEISPQIIWARYPQKELSILMDMFGVSADKITDFIMSKFDINDYMTRVRNYVEQALVEPEQYISVPGEDPKPVPIKENKPVSGRGTKTKK